MAEHNPPPYQEGDTVFPDEKKKPPLDEDASPAYTEASDLTATTSATPSASETYGKRGPKLDAVPIDSSRPLVPTRVFWIPWFSSFSKTLKVHDISAPMLGHWQGAVNKEYRELAKAMYEKYQKGNDELAYSAVDVAKIRQRYSFRDGAGEEICMWKHGWHSLAEVGWTFPAGSKRVGGAEEEQKVAFIKANRIFTRDRVFVLDGTMYAVEMESSWRSNQWTIWKLRDGSKIPVARYGMKYGSQWFCGGCVAVDGEGIDEAVAVLACLVVMRQNKQRAAERSAGAGGGGGGGGGGG